MDLGHHHHRRNNEDDEDNYGGRRRNDDYPEEPRSELNRPPAYGRNEFSEGFQKESRPDFYRRPPEFERNEFFEESNQDFNRPPQHGRNEFSEGFNDEPRQEFNRPAGYGGNKFSEGYSDEPRPDFDSRPPAYGGSEFSEGFSDGSRPVYGSVQHISHEVDQGFDQPGRHEYGTSEGRFGDDYQRQQGHGGRERVQTLRVFTKAEENYSLTVRDGNVILARSDPNDEYQHWIKDLKFSTRVKDEEGFPSFALVNKATGEAIKHSIGATHPVRLVPYNPDYLDESILWTESRDLGDGFRCIRMVNNIGLNFDAFHGDEDHGGVRDGTTVVLWEWLKGNNQRWRIVPHCKFLKNPLLASSNLTEKFYHVNLCHISATNGIETNGRECKS